MSNDNQALNTAIDNAIHLIEVAIQEQQEARKVLMKGLNGKQQEGRKAPK